LAASTLDAAAALMTHAGDEDAQRHGAAALAGVRLVHHGRLAAALALDAQEPGREGTQRLL
jgi:hypothetical protein